MRGQPITLRGRPAFVNQPATLTGECVHFWRIETPSGRTSNGVCRKCGAERSFVNSSDYYIESDFENRYAR